MNAIDKLIRIFGQFPGIGPRQARRFVYFLLTRNNGAIEELSKNLLELKKDIVMCKNCMRFYQKKHEENNLCNICTDQTRDQTILMLVQRDVDLESVEKNGEFRGIYFVLGGSVPILEKEPEKKIRIKELKTFIGLQQAQNKQLGEIILGMNWNPEGENTADYVTKVLNTECSTLTNKTKITHLGKGLSMGSELEYTDSDTLKNALKNRG